MTAPVTVLVVVLALVVDPKNDEAQKLGQPSKTEDAAEQPASAARPPEPASQSTAPTPGPELPVEYGSEVIREKDGALGNSQSQVMRETVSPEVDADHVALSATPVAASASDTALSCPEPVPIEIDYDEPVPVRTIAADAVEQWGLQAEGLDVVPRDRSRKFHWAPSAASALNALSRNAEWTWYRDGDTVRFVRRDDPGPPYRRHRAR